MKTTYRITLAVVALIALTGTLLGQVVTNAVPGVSVPLPTSTKELWTLGLAGATPLIVGFIYQYVPKIPKWMLPASTPFVGVLLGLGLNYAAKANLEWLDMAQAGALAVFVREVYTNTVTKQLAGMSSTPPAPVPPATPTPPVP